MSLVNQRCVPGALAAAALAVVLAVGPALGLTGCQHNPNTALFTTVHPQPADVAGDYVLDAASVRLVADAGYAARTAKIHLVADGTLSFEDLPDWWDDPAEPFRGGFDTGSGV